MLINLPQCTAFFPFLTPLAFIWIQLVLSLYKRRPLACFHFNWCNCQLFVILSCFTPWLQPHLSLNSSHLHHDKMCEKLLLFLKDATWNDWKRYRSGVSVVGRTDRLWTAWHCHTTSRWPKSVPEIGWEPLCSILSLFNTGRYDGRRHNQNHLTG